MENTNQTKDKKSPDIAADKNILEWITFGVSLLLILCLVCFLAYKTYTHQPSTPEIALSYYADPVAGSPYRYHVQLSNEGGLTAEAVVIELLLMKGNEVVDRSELEFDFVPQQSKRQGWVNFLQNPADADTLLAKVASFKKP